jgi:hypothetical protein
MLLAHLPGVDPDALNSVHIIDSVLSFLFIYDFSLGLLAAPSRSKYLIRDHGWADLPAVVPQFRIFWLVRRWKACRIVHRYGLRHSTSCSSRNRSAAAVRSWTRWPS